MTEKIDFSNKNVTIMGLGLNGGGLASAIFFAKANANVTVTDMKTETELIASIEKLKAYKNIKYRLGCHDIFDFENADIVVKNPAVKMKGNQFLAKAKHIESDISLFCKYSKSPIIAVTGSKGKSSTVSAIHYGLSNVGIKSFLGGNITVSPLSFLEETTYKTPVVLELSSWQLADLKTCTNFKPHISLITPIIPDHQNWYTNMEEYVADKKIIYQNQDQTDISIFNSDDTWGKIFSQESKANIAYYGFDKKHNKGISVYFNEKGEGCLQVEDSSYTILPLETKVMGKPQRQNLLNAGLVMYLYGIPYEKIGPVLKNYPGIPHRLENFYEYEEFSFYNDSAATVPEATISALNAFDLAKFEKPILIAGGTDKNLNFESLSLELKKASKIFLLEGSATNLLINEAKKQSVSFEGPFSSLETLLLRLKTFLKTYPKTEKRVPILFSPGATSFGMFKNEFDRGMQFKNLVTTIF